MKKSIRLGLLCVIFALTISMANAQKMAENIQAPIAKIIPKTLVKHNHTRIDNYYWLNERENPEVITYLNQENEYYNAKTADTKEFQKELFEEMKARIKEDDQSVPYFYNGYFYITRYEKGQDYPIYSRKKGSLTAAEEILFNCNELAKGQSYFQLGGMSISPDNKYASFGVDTKGRRIYTIQIKNLETGEILSDKIENVTGGSVWANDNATIFYTQQDKVTLRADNVTNSFYDLNFPDKPAGTYTLATLDDIKKIDLTGRVYENNAASISGGLTVNDVYRTSTGELRIVV